MTILVVDDSKTILAIISFVLKKEGYIIECCRSAEDALSYLNDHIVDLIITDINMPGLGGEALINKVRSNPKYKELPIIVTSTIAESEAILPGVTAWAFKPLNPQKLVALIESFKID